MRYAKRIVSLALTCLIVFSLVPPVTVQAATSQKAITYLVNNGILRGYGNSNLGLTDNVTREQFVTFLHRMAGEPGTSTKNSFEDMKGISNEYKKAINWAKDKGITTGVSTTKFGVGGTLKYEQILTFLYRFGVMIYGANSQNMQATKTPGWIGSYSDWARTAAKWAYTKGLTSGVSVQTGTKECPRGDVIQLLYNFYKVFQKKYALIGQDAVLIYDLDDMMNCELMETSLLNADFSLANNITRFGYRGQDDIDTKDDLQDLVNKAFKHATCIDVCYIYIFCHGYYGNYDTGGFSVCVEGTDGITPKKIGKRRVENLVMAEDFYKMVEGVRGKPKFIIMIDSCYSGFFTQKFREKKSRADVMVSCGTGESSRVSKGNCTAATYCWSKAIASRLADRNLSYKFTYEKKTFEMKGKGGNNDGFTSLEEVEKTIQEVVTKLARVSTLPGQEQDTNYYSPSSQPAYCAFGKLD